MEREEEEEARSETDFVNESRKGKESGRRHSRRKCTRTSERKREVGWGSAPTGDMWDGVGWGGVENGTAAQTGKDIDRLLPVLCALSPRQPTNDERNESPPMAALQTHIYNIQYTHRTAHTVLGSAVADRLSATTPPLSTPTYKDSSGSFQQCTKKGGKKQVLCQRDIFFGDWCIELNRLSFTSAVVVVISLL